MQTKAHLRPHEHGNILKFDFCKIRTQVFTTVDVFALIKNKYVLKIYCLSPCVTVTLVIQQNLVAWKKAKFGFDVFSGLLTLTFEPETYAAYFQGLSLNVFYLQGYFNKI